MAETTTYTCDLCKTSAVNDPKFLNSVRVDVGNNYSSSGYSASMIPVQRWCAACLIKMGLIHPGSISHAASEAPVVQPTLEEVIREIVREEIEAS